uniref:Uncharacterized protein n=1 Tax=viral metagenome TaxID=1070528 RepID=A0A6C0EXK7_9ZZZZ
MDDYTSNILNDSKNEWSILLINYITPHIMDGFKAIFNESIKLCESNDEIEKYLMTYQNLLSRIPKWNQTIVLAEQERIIKLCNCSYLEDLITCVHILQLKILSCVRVGNESKKVSIDIPDMTTFIHQIYINIARKLYSNIYLFEIDVPPLEQQRRNREFELMVQTCIMNTVRDKIPVETLLRQYIDETQEIEVTKVEKVMNTTAKPMDNNTNNNTNNTNTNSNNKSFDEINESFDNSVKINTEANSIPNKSEPMNMNTNMNTNMNANKFSFNDSIKTDDIYERKPSISFNPVPSVLEIEGNNNDDSIKIGDESTNTSISFEELDSTPINLDFEEL